MTPGNAPQDPPGKSSDRPPRRSVAEIKSGLIDWSDARDTQTKNGWARTGAIVVGGAGAIALIWGISRVLRRPAAKSKRSDLQAAQPTVLQTIGRQAVKLSVLWRLGGWLLSQHQARQSDSAPAARPASRARQHQTSGKLPLKQGHLN